MGDAHVGVPSGNVSCNGSSHSTQDSGIVLSPTSSIFIQYWKPLVTPLTCNIPSGGELVTAAGELGWSGSDRESATGEDSLSVDEFLFSLVGMGVDINCGVELCRKKKRRSLRKYMP